MSRDTIDPFHKYALVLSPEGLPDEEQLRLQGKSALKKYYPDEAEAGRVFGEIERLLRSFGGKVWLGLRHAAPCPTFRDETIAELTARAACRFPTRVHLFEESLNGGAGRYLGFISLRPTGAFGECDWRDLGEAGGFDHVSEAELVCPRRMLRPRWHIIQGTASPSRLGVLPFRSTLFTAPHGDRSRASTCVHLAVTQALHLVMGRFDCKPISEREFETALWQEGLSKAIGTPAKQGVRLDEALTIMPEYCHAGGFIVFYQEAAYAGRKSTMYKEAHRVLTDTLANGLPVVMMVRPAKLYPGSSGSSGVDANSLGQAATPEQSALREPHAVLVFGMHLLHSEYEIGRAMHTQPREDEAELPGTFVGNDVITGAFTEWTMQSLFDSACAVGEPSDAGSISFLAIGPKEMKLGLDQVRAIATQRTTELYRQERDLFDHYRQQFSGKHSRSPAHPGEWRFVTRLLRKGELQARYFGRPGSRPDPGTSQEQFDKLTPQVFWWAVEVLLPINKKTPPCVQTPDPLLVFIWGVSDGPLDPLLIRKRVDAATYSWKSREVRGWV